MKSGQRLAEGGKHKQVASVKLTRYAPDLTQRSHTHGAPHISLVLAGYFREEVGRSEMAIGAGRVGFRPEGVRHAVSFSQRGGLILTCAFPTLAASITAPRWSAPLPREQLRTLTPLLMSGDAEAEEAGWDLMALAEAEPGRRRSASKWLLQVRDQLIEEPAAANISKIAQRTGRHRVHVGRAFLAAFGEPPSVYRRRAMLDRALSAMASGATSAASAAEGGFADQSHFHRACRESFGLTPRQITRGTADVAFVQYASA